MRSDSRSCSSRSAPRSSRTGCRSTTRISFVIVEGLIRVTVFVLYIVLIGLLPDLKRVFQYHAAEHKAINALEAGSELTPDKVQKFSLIHPRCGTAFLLWVMVIGIFVFAFVGRPVWYWLIISRILLLPVIAGLAYELIRYAGKHQGNRVLMTALAPGSLAATAHDPPAGSSIRSRSRFVHSKR